VEGKDSIYRIEALILTLPQAPRTAQWAAHKVERTESKFSELFKHHTRQAGIISLTKIFSRSQLLSYFAGVETEV
jgi:hypothetical protein